MTAEYISIYPSPLSMDKKPTVELSGASACRTVLGKSAIPATITPVAAGAKRWLLLAHTFQV